MSRYSDQLAHIFTKWAPYELEDGLWDPSRRWAEPMYWSTGTTDLNDFVRTIGEMFDVYEPYVSDRVDGTVGWQALVDVDKAPYEGLPYLAQWVGERLPQGLSDADARDWIRHTPNQLRGTKRGIAKSAMRTLIGSRTVMLRPRHKLDGTAHADYLTVLTQDSETPDPDVVVADILRAMPAWIELNYDHPAGVIWTTVEAEGAWADVATDGTWADVGQAGISTGGGWYVFTVSDLAAFA